MQRWRGLTSAAVAGCILLLVAGCFPPDVVRPEQVDVTGHEASGVLAGAYHILGTHDILIPASDVQSYADRAGVSATTWSDVARGIASTPPWESIRTELAASGLGERTRDVIVGTACELLLLADSGHPGNPWTVFAQNVYGLVPYQESVQLASDAFQVLWADQNDGQKTDEAAVSIGCYIVARVLR